MTQDSAQQTVKPASILFVAHLNSCAGDLDCPAFFSKLCEFLGLPPAGYLQLKLRQASILSTVRQGIHRGFPDCEAQEEGANSFLSRKALVHHELQDCVREKHSMPTFAEELQKSPEPPCILHGRQSCKHRILCVNHKHIGFVL